MEPLDFIIYLNPAYGQYELHIALRSSDGRRRIARGRQADTIARLERENADLRRQVEALQGARRVALMLTDRDPWWGGCYDAGEVTVTQLRGAG